MVPTRPGWTALVAAGLVASGCSGLLDVEDPQRYTSNDLDQSLEQVADGVEGKLHRAIHLFVIGTGLLSDELQASGTWSDWERIDQGRIEYGLFTSNIWSRGPDAEPYETLLHARWFAGDARERFERVLGNEAGVLTARVDALEGLADLYLAQGFCEAPAVPDGPAVQDLELYRRAVQTFTRVIESAQAPETWRLVSRAGRARAHLMLGDYDDALADAASIAGGWAYDAVYSGSGDRQYNYVVYLTTRGYNGSATVRRKWWDRVDPDAHLLLDPWTQEPDPRVPIYFDGSPATDGVTPHYSQWKYRDLGDDIPMLHSGEMRLIEAEVRWRRGELAQALGILNQLRAGVGLSPLPATEDPDRILDYLLQERFAETFLEGQRMNDLHRFGRVQGMIEVGDFVGSESVRPTKFPLLAVEARYNPNIEDNPAVRCLPMSR